MIYKILDPEDVSELFESLKFHLPGSSKIFYVVDQILKGKCPGFEIITDNWPNWTCVLGRPKADNTLVPDFLKSTYVCHTNSNKALKYFIQRPGVINWHKPLVLSGIPYDLTCTLKEVSKKNGGSLSNQNQCFMYAWQQKEPPPQPEIPKNLRLDCLDPRQAKSLSRQWYRTGQSEEEDLSQRLMSMLLENFESTCLIGSDKEVLAYAWVQNYGSMGGLFVQPEHRRKGYGIMVMQDLTRKVMQTGHVPYVYTVTNNTPAIKMMQKLGFRWVPSGDTTWVQHTPRSLLHPDGKPRVELPLI